MQQTKITKYNQLKKGKYVTFFISLIFIQFINMGNIFTIDLNAPIMINNNSDQTNFYAQNDPKIVFGNSFTDSNKNKISDGLENLISNSVIYQHSDLIASNNELNTVEVIIGTKIPPNEELIQKIKSYGAEILSVYKDVIYGVAARVPISEISALSLDYDISYIGENGKVTSHLDTATINLGARGSSYVWSSESPIKGNSSYSVAILDTGIDTTHSDLENVIYFHDFTNLGYPNGSTGVDKYGHGTHCAAIAAGTGSADTNPIQINQSFSYHFPDQLDVSYLHWFEIKENSGNPDTIASISWDNSSGGSVRLVFVNSNNFIVGSAIESSDSTFSNNVGKLSAGWYRIACEPRSNPAKLKNYSVSVLHEYNYTLPSENSGTPLFSGVAPNSKIVGLKVMNDWGLGSESWLLNALNWIAANGSKHQYNITVVSMSLGLNTISSAVDTAVNNLVDQGFICIASAGNDGTNNGQNAIRSPGSAAKCITVGAINEAFQIAYYSSNGNVTINKPDVVAPGGSIAYSGSNAPYNTIIAADSNVNDSDAFNILDTSPNNYIGMQGTSMSCPMVAGIALLAIDKIIQNENKPWAWSGANALKIKQLICMATWEVEGGESFDGDGDGIDQNPTINRTGKDKVEGYGMVRADAVIQGLNNTRPDQFSKYQYYLDRRNETHAKDYKVILFPADFDASKQYNISLEVPSTGDFDLILYNRSYNIINGEPVILKNSTTSGLGVKENITFSPTESGTYYWSVRAVSGYGLCNVSINLLVNTNVESNISRLIASPNCHAELKCTFEDGATRTPFVGKTIQCSTNLGLLNVSSAVTDSNGEIYLKLIGEYITGSSQFATITFSSNDPIFTSTYQIEFVANDIPILSHPNDIYYGQTNSSTIYINWTVLDLNYTASANYTITISGDASGSESGYWALTQEIGINVSGLSIGTYYYNLEISDGYGGSASDLVVVTVTEFEYVLTVVSNLSFVIANEKFDVLLTCYFLYQNVTPAVGTTISISTDLGTLNSTSEITDTDGKIMIIITGQEIVESNKYANVRFQAPTLDGFDQIYQINFVHNDIPKIIYPRDMQFVQGTTQIQRINWTIKDTYFSPNANYTICITGNLTDTIEGNWIGNIPILIDVSELPVGYYNFTIYIDDGFGAIVTDTVIVIVIAPRSFNIFFMIPIGMIVCLTLTLILKHKKEKNALKTTVNDF